MQMAPSPIKRDNANHWDGTTMDHFLTDLRDEKLFCISQVRRYRILQGAFSNSDIATTMV